MVVKQEFEVSYMYYNSEGREGNGVYRCQTLKDAQHYAEILRGFKSITDIHINTVEKSHEKSLHREKR